MSKEVNHLDVIDYLKESIAMTDELIEVTTINEILKKAKYDKWVLERAIDIVEEIAPIRDIEEMVRGWEDDYTMDANTRPGEKVVVTERSSRNGRNYDRADVAEHLEVGKEYTVDQMMVGGSSSSVWLEEVPEAFFNSVNFENVQKGR